MQNKHNLIRLSAFAQVIAINLTINTATISTIYFLSSLSLRLKRKLNTHAHTHTFNFI